MDFNELDTITPEEAGIDPDAADETETTAPAPPPDGPVRKVLLTAFIVLFFVLTLIPITGMMLGLGGENNENRTLADMPALTTVDTNGHTRINGSFSPQFEEFIADNFGFRQEIVSGWSSVMYRVFASSAVNNVMVGQDGWLYYASTRADYEGSAPYSDRTVFRIAKTVELMNRCAEDSGAVFAFTVAPNKATIYPEQLPARLRPAESTNLDRVSALLSESGCYIDLTAPLTALKDSGTQSYYKLDSHWTNAGALEAYRAITEHYTARIPGMTVPDYGDIPTQPTSHNGDLSTMLIPQFPNPESEQSPVYEKYFTSGSPITNRLAVDIRTANPEGFSSLCMMRDSFGSALIEPFSDAFGRVRYDRALPYNLRGAVEEQYKLILIELVERNLIELVARVPVADMPPCAAPARSEAADSVALCTTSAADGRLTVSGLLSEDITLADNDCIYIEFRSGERSVFFEAFPIAEGDGHCDRGFSLTIPEAELLQGEYTLHLHVGTPESTVCYELYQ